MRFLVLTVCLVGAASSVRADRVVAVDERTLPARCRPVAMVSRDARTIEPTLDAYVSTANCMAEARLYSLNVTPTSRCVKAFDVAVQLSLDLLDTVIEHGDIAHQIVAAHAKADLYQAMAVRVLSAVPPLPKNAIPAAVIEHDREVRVASQLVQPWRARSLEANRKVTELADRAPVQVASDPVVAYAAEDSRRLVAPNVARR